MFVSTVTQRRKRAAHTHTHTPPSTWGLRERGEKASEKFKFSPSGHEGVIQHQSVPRLLTSSSVSFSPNARRRSPFLQYMCTCVNSILCGFCL